MTAPEFANRLCKRLLDDGFILEDGIPHHRIHTAALILFPEVKAAIEAELKQATVVDQRVPQRPVTLPDRP